MKRYLSYDNDFVKVEFCDCNFKKPTTLAKHMLEFIHESTGLLENELFDNSWFFFKSLIAKNNYEIKNIKNDDVGNIHYVENWDYVKGIDLKNYDFERNSLPQKIAWVIDFTCDDSVYHYGYIGFSVEPEFGFDQNVDIEKIKANINPWSEDLENF